MLNYLHTHTYIYHGEIVVSPRLTRSLIKLIVAHDVVLRTFGFREANDAQITSRTLNIDLAPRWTRAKQINYVLAQQHLGGRV